jgi:hypothetical protein
MNTLRFIGCSFGRDEHMLIDRRRRYETGVGIVLLPWRLAFGMYGHGYAA